jgi:general secretion pathway protein J
MNRSAPFRCPPYGAAAAPTAARRQPARGFTLVEVLVALTIMAVLSTMAWQGIDGIVRARDISQAQLDRSLHLNTVMAQWDRDLMALQDTPAVPSLAFDGANLRLVRQAPGGLQLVAWTRQGTEWLRWAGPVVTRVADLQESWLRSQQLLGNDSGMLKLLDGVTGIQVEFFRENSWTNSQSTGDLAGSPPGNTVSKPERLPNGVRLVLSFGEQRLTRDIVLATQTP